jgi:hypothetical protein
MNDFRAIEDALEEWVDIKGVTVILPIPGYAHSMSSSQGPAKRNTPSDLFFRRVVKAHIAPFPPLADPDAPFPVPVIALCLPFTEDDQLRYANRHNLVPHLPMGSRKESALLHLRQRLPRGYTRWVTLGSYTRAVVLATNESKSNLALGFKLDLLEEIRRLMGVRWIPTWNLPETGIQKTIYKGCPAIDQSFVNWPEDLYSVRDLTWEGLDMLKADEWRVLWLMLEVRLEMYARAKNEKVPPSNIPMFKSFQLDEP